MYYTRWHCCAGYDRVAMVCRYAPLVSSEKTATETVPLRRCSIRSMSVSRLLLYGRYAPWWLNVQEFSGNQVGYLSLEDWQALPQSAQPLLRHLVR